MLMMAPSLLRWSVLSPPPSAQTGTQHYAAVPREASTLLGASPSGQPSQRPCEAASTCLARRAAASSCWAKGRAPPSVLPSPRPSVVVPPQASPPVRHWTFSVQPARQLSGQGPQHPRSGWQLMCPSRTAAPGQPTFVWPSCGASPLAVAAPQPACAREGAACKPRGRVSALCSKVLEVREVRSKENELTVRSEPLAVIMQ